MCQVPQEGLALKNLEQNLYFAIFFLLLSGPTSHWTSMYSHAGEVVAFIRFVAVLPETLLFCEEQVPPSSPPLVGGICS